MSAPVAPDPGTPARGPASAVASLVATWFGCGLSPWAPGTVGSLGTVPLHLLLCRLGAPLHLAVVVLVSALGFWAAQRYAEQRGETDPGRVVIDEVAGTLIALGCVRNQGVPILLVAFIAFRALDIWKPGPIRRLEHTRPLGAGIMLDDLLAGVGAGALAWLALRALG
jgi:phosphatidylglycerophosphatase A